MEPERLNAVLARVPMSPWSEWEEFVHLRWSSNSEECHRNVQEVGSRVYCLREKCLPIRHEGGISDPRGADPGPSYQTIPVRRKDARSWSKSLPFCQRKMRKKKIISKKKKRELCNETTHYECPESGAIVRGHGLCQTCTDIWRKFSVLNVQPMSHGLLIYGRISLRLLAQVSRVSWLSNTFETQWYWVYHWVSTGRARKRLLEFGFVCCWSRKAFVREPRPLIKFVISTAFWRVSLCSPSPIMSFTRRFKTWAAQPFAKMWGYRRSMMSQAALIQLALSVTTELTLSFPSSSMTSHNLSAISSPVWEVPVVSITLYRIGLWLGIRPT